MNPKTLQYIMGHADISVTLNTYTHEMCIRDRIPTVHMGAAVCALERKEIETNIGNLNRDIKAANRMMNACLLYTSEADKFCLQQR